MRSTLRRTVLATAVTALAAAAVLPAAAAPSKGAGGPCTGSPARVAELRYTVQGQTAKALYALPTGKPRGIVVFDHGYGHTMQSWRRHIARTAKTLGVIAVAPDYRGQIDIPATKPGGLPSSRGWRVAEGAADTIAVAQLFEKRCHPTGPNVVYGVSMGGNTSGLVVAAKPKDAAGRPLFDYWVDVEGAANVTETYQGARALAPVNEFATNAVADIEQAFGGSFEQVPDVYADRTIVNRTPDIAAAGLKGVVMVHGVVDGLVTHDISRQLQVLLRAQGVPVDMWAAVTRTADSEPGTTLDGYAPTGQTSPFAGHASEPSETHVVGQAGFAALARLYSGAPFVCGEKVFDGMTGLAAGAPATC